MDDVKQRRYKANQLHRLGVYSSTVGYCRDEIIRDSEQARRGEDIPKYKTTLFLWFGKIIFKRT
jgi:hypothetical protein